MKEWTQVKCTPKITVCEMIVLPNDIDSKDITFYLIPVVKKEDKE